MYQRGLTLSDALRPARWSPSRLFLPPDQGLLLQPARLDLMDQLAAGGSPVTAPGQPVGLMRRAAGTVDAAQAVSAARPTLGRHPRSGLRNRQPRSEAAGMADAWNVTGFTPTDQAITESIRGTAVDADMRQYAVYDRTNLTWIVPRTIWSAGDGRKSVSFLAPAGCTEASFHPATASSAKQIYAQGIGTAVTPGQTYTASWFVVGNSFGGVQIEQGAVMTPYQRTAGPHDVTESSVPDLWYLSTDGIDDFLATASVAWGTDEVSVIAAVTRQHSEVNADLVGLSTTPGAAGGKFALSSTSDTPSLNAGFSSSGDTANALARAASTPIQSPIILTGMGQIGNDTALIRRNGVQIQSVTVDQGAGLYNAAPLFIGARGGLGRFFAGRIYSLLAINRLLNPTELTLAERWMAGRCGVTL